MSPELKEPSVQQKRLTKEQAISRKAATVCALVAKMGQKRKSLNYIEGDGQGIFTMIIIDNLFVSTHHVSGSLLSALCGLCYCILTVR